MSISISESFGDHRHLVSLFFYFYDSFYLMLVLVQVIHYDYSACFL